MKFVKSAVLAVGLLLLAQGAASPRAPATPQDQAASSLRRPAEVRVLGPPRRSASAW